MWRLSDDELGLIFERINGENDRKSLSLVCKNWLRLERLTRTHSSLKISEPDSLAFVLPKFPNLRKVETSKKAIPITDQHLQTIAQFCPNLEVINLNIDDKLKKFRWQWHPLSSNDVGDKGLCALAAGCVNLSQVSVEGRCNIGNAGVISLFNSAAKHLRHLDLSRCYLISDKALEAIAGSKFIVDLKLVDCVSITDYGLSCLASGFSSKSLRRLILAGCHQIRDSGLCQLQKISGLEELDISYGSTKVTEIGFLGVSKIESLKKLSLSFVDSWCPQTGFEYTSPSAIRAFANHETLESLAITFVYKIDADILESTLRSCKSLKCVTMPGFVLATKIPLATRQKISEFCELRWGP